MRTDTLSRYDHSAQRRDLLRALLFLSVLLMISYATTAWGDEVHLNTLVDAAEQGDAEAQFKLGEKYREGRGRSAG